MALHDHLRDAALIDAIPLEEVISSTWPALGVNRYVDVQGIMRVRVAPSPRQMQYTILEAAVVPASGGLVIVGLLTKSGHCCSYTVERKDIMSAIRRSGFPNTGLLWYRAMLGPAWSKLISKLGI